MRNNCTVQIFRIKNIDNLYIYFGSNLKYLLKQKGITGKDLAKKLGKAPTTISAWVSGRSYPRLDQVFKMMEIFELKSLDRFILENAQNPGDVSDVENPYSAIEELREEVERLRKKVEG